MTPKEKAKELVDKYTEIIYPIMNMGKIKQCALIAVDELIWSINLYDSTSIFWQEVKQEIEAL